MNIKDYEFSDYAMFKVVCANGIAVSIDTKSAPWVALYKDDAIALAKHFKLTAQDLVLVEVITPISEDYEEICESQKAMVASINNELDKVKE